MYLGGTTTKALQHEVSTCRQIYYNKETCVMANQSVNEFYTQFLFKIDSLPQDLVFPLGIDTTGKPPSKIKVVRHDSVQR